MLNEEKSVDVFKTLRALYIVSLANESIWISAELFERKMLNELVDLEFIRFNKSKKSVTITAEGVGACLELPFWDWDTVANYL